LNFQISTWHVEIWKFKLAHTLRIPQRGGVVLCYVQWRNITSFSSLLNRCRCLHGRWSCWRRSVSFPSGCRSSARSCAHVDALLSRGRSSACCCLARTWTFSSPTASESLSPKVEISQMPMWSVTYSNSLTRSSSNLARFLLNPTEHHYNYGVRVRILSWPLLCVIWPVTSYHCFIVIRCSLPWCKPPVPFFIDLVIIIIIIIIIIIVIIC